jgi:hypothetical protein
LPAQTEAGEKNSLVADQHDLRTRQKIDQFPVFSFGVEQSNKCPGHDGSKPGCNDKSRAMSPDVVRVSVATFYFNKNTDQTMDNTTTIQLIIFLVDLFWLAVFFRVVFAHKAKLDDWFDADDGSPKPKYPVAQLLIAGTVLLFFAFGGDIINHRLLESEVVTPAVNSTMEQQIYQDAEGEIEVKPVVEPSAIDTE